MATDRFVIGIDFGTDSVRSVLVNAFSGEEAASSVFYYPRWKAGLYCDAGKNIFRQHPLDYIEGMEYTISQCIRGKDPQQIIAISADTTGSTPVAADRSGTPLALLPGFSEDPDAMFVLWKDHSAVHEAAEINVHAARFPVNYLKYVGGIYSSEWFYAKWLHIVRGNERVNNRYFTWVEHCDWIPFLLTGGNDVRQIKRGVCAAGHKALWAPEFGGLPPDNFFESLDPLLTAMNNRLFSETWTCDQPAGRLSAEWAERLGLHNDVIVGIGGFDAHMGAVGGQIEPYYLSKVMGTSTCDMLIAPMDETRHILVKGICGQVAGSIIPGMMGMEAGQSAFGDAYAWLKNILLWPLSNGLLQHSHPDNSAISALRQRAEEEILSALSKAAQELPPDCTEFAVDWFNGRRTPDASQEVRGMIAGLTLGTDAPRLFRSIVEATCFGARAITDRFQREGVPIKGVIGLGGVARKSPYIMQMMADVLNMPIRIHRSEQTCAAGAAMFAATAAGVYDHIEAAMKAMGSGFDMTYIPDPEKHQQYAQRYPLYQQAGNFLETLRRHRYTV